MHCISHWSQQNCCCLNKPLGHWGVEAVWPVKSRQMSIKVPKNDFTWKILKPLQKSPNNVGDLGKLIVAIGFEKLPKVQ